MASSRAGKGSGSAACHILVDDDLERLIRRGQLVDLLYGDRRKYREESAVQPASLDLHIGKIYVPEQADGEEGSVSAPSADYSLPPGHTAMIRTKERLSIPKDIAGIGFPLSRKSSRGLLMTNPGHVDPGYYGEMSFTVINMGRRPFTLREGDAIASLLLFKLGKPAQAGFADRYGGRTPTEVTKAKLSRLSQDFLDVTKRTRNIVLEEEQKTRRWVIFAPALVVALGILGSIVGSWYQAQTSLGDRLKELEARTTVLESRAELRAIEERLDALEAASE